MTAKNIEIQKYRMQFAIAELRIQSLFDGEFDLFRVLDDVSKGEFRGWVIGDVTKVKDTYDREFIFARLGRTKVGVRNETFDKDKASFRKELIPEKTAYRTNFVLHQTRADRYRMAIQETSSIPLSVFKKQFNSLIRAVSEKEIGEIVVQENTEDIMAILRSFSSIDKASFKQLRVPNPKSDPEFKTLELLLKDSNTHRANLELTGGQDGLMLDKGLMKEATKLTEAGYGTAKYTGERFFKRVVFSFEDRVIRFMGKMHDTAKDVVHQVAVLLVGEDDE